MLVPGRERREEREVVVVVVETGMPVVRSCLPKRTKYITSGICKSVKRKESSEHIYMAAGEVIQTRRNGTGMAGI